MTTVITITDEVITVDGAVVKRLQTNGKTQANPGIATSTIGAVATGQPGGTGTSPAQGSMASPAGSQYNLGRTHMDDGASAPMSFPSDANGQGEMEVDCDPGTKMTFKFVVPDSANRPGVGFIKFRAPDGLDNLVIAASITQGPGDPGASAPVAFYPFKVGQPEQMGYSNLVPGGEYSVNIRADSGKFVMQVQLPH